MILYFSVFHASLRFFYQKVNKESKSEQNRKLKDFHHLRGDSKFTGEGCLILFVISVTNSHIPSAAQLW